MSGRRGAGPCKQLTRCWKRPVRAAGGKVKLVKMNIDDHPTIAGQLWHPVDTIGQRLQGRPAGRLASLAPFRRARSDEFMKKIGGKNGGAPPVAEALAAAAEARDACDAQTASDIYDGNPATAPETVEAIGRAGRAAVRGR